MTQTQSKHGLAAALLYFPGNFIQLDVTSPCTTVRQTNHERRTNHEIMALLKEGETSGGVTHLVEREERGKHEINFFFNKSVLYSWGLCLARQTMD